MSRCAEQAAAAVGQIRLARAYEEALAPHGITTGQVLVTLEDSANRRRYLNSRAAAGLSTSIDHSAEALLLGRALARQTGDQDAAALWERALRRLYPELEYEQETAEQ